MRIGFDAKRVFHNHTGLGVYGRVLLKHLSRDLNQHAYHLFSPRLSTHSISQPFLTSPFQTHSYGGPRILGSAWRRYGIGKQASHAKIDLYHGLSHELPTGLSKRRIRSVVSIHDLIFERFPAHYPWLDRFFYRQKVKHSCRVADRIVAISEATKRDLIELYGIDSEKITVIYQTCDDLFWKAERENKVQALLPEWNLPSEYLLMVGTGPRKNVKVVLEAMRIHETPSLVVVGRPSAQMDGLVSLLTRMGLDKQFFFLPNVATKDLPRLYQHASLLLFPSVYEGFGIPILEALLCGTPVIAANNSALPEAGGPHSQYFSADHPEELASTIQRVLTDSQLRKAMITAGHQYAQQFSPHILSQQWQEVYQTTVDGPWSTVKSGK